MSPLVAHATSYPFAIPQNSYVLGAKGYREIAPDQPLPDLDGLTAVLASGSNQSPEQLTRKFDDLDSNPIPVTRVRIRDFDAVHSPHFSAYGSIPATLVFHPGVEATIFTTWLTDRQLDRMHETEVATENYHFVRLDNITLDIIGAKRLTSVHAYIARRGVLCHDGKPLGLARVPATGRSWAKVSQIEVQTIARDRLAPDTGLTEFISGNIENPDIRRAHTRQLAEDALPFGYPVTVVK